MDHTFPKTGSKIFFAKGLDRDLRKSLVGQISLRQGFAIKRGFVLLACRTEPNSEDLKMRAKSRILVSFATCGLLLQFGLAHAATVVALGASNTAGKGVSPGEAYPAQLETMLRARGLDVNVINAGISGDTTGGMMARLESAVPKGTKVVILQPGGNDLRKGAPNYTSELRSRLSAMGVKVVMLPNEMLRGKPHQPDGMHLTPEGYHMLAQQLVGAVASALRK